MAPSPVRYQQQILLKKIFTFDKHLFSLFCLPEDRSNTNKGYTRV